MYNTVHKPLTLQQLNLLYFHQFSSCEMSFITSNLLFKQARELTGILHWLAIIRTSTDTVKQITHITCADSVTTYPAGSSDWTRTNESLLAHWTGALKVECYVRYEAQTCCMTGACTPPGCICGRTCCCNTICCWGWMMYWAPLAALTTCRIWPGQPTERLYLGL